MVAKEKMEGKNEYQNIKDFKRELLKLYNFSWGLLKRTQIKVNLNPFISLGCIMDNKILNFNQTRI